MVFFNIMNFPKKNPLYSKTFINFSVAVVGILQIEMVRREVSFFNCLKAHTLWSFMLLGRKICTELDSYLIYEICRLDSRQVLVTGFSLDSVKFKNKQLQDNHMRINSSDPTMPNAIKRNDDLDHQFFHLELFFFRIKFTVLHSLFWENETPMFRDKDVIRFSR